MHTLLDLTCLACCKPFRALAAEVSRDNAKYCSRSCCARHGNLNRPLFSRTCCHCNNTYVTKAAHSKYCSTTCKQAALRKRQHPTTKKVKHLNYLVSQFVDTFSCFNCGWGKAICDVHHIVPKSKGGSDAHSNLTVVCPNCHRLIHKNLLDVTFLPTVSSRYRTISSPEELQQVLGALAGIPVVSAPSPSQELGSGLACP